MSSSHHPSAPCKRFDALPAGARRIWAKSAEVDGEAGGQRLWRLETEYALGHCGHIQQVGQQAVTASKPRWARARPNSRCWPTCACRPR